MDCNWEYNAGKLTCKSCGIVSRGNYVNETAKWPRRNCKQESQDDTNSPRETVLAYLREHPGSTIGEIITACVGCKDRLAEALREAVAAGEARKEGEWPPVYFLAEKQKP